MTFAVLLPGQGSQFVGMGADLFEARPDLLGDAADEVLGFSLREVCLEGPEERLTRTEHAQPALFALSYALWEELSKQFPPPAAAAGHSLGEYTALVAAGMLSYRDALSVVAERGRAMAAASDANPSSMAAVIGVDLEAVEAACSVRRSEGGSLCGAEHHRTGTGRGGRRRLCRRLPGGEAFGPRSASRDGPGGGGRLPLAIHAARIRPPVLGVRRCRDLGRAISRVLQRHCQARLQRRPGCHPRRPGGVSGPVRRDTREHGGGRHR